MALNKKMFILIIITKLNEVKYKYLQKGVFLYLSFQYKSIESFHNQIMPAVDQPRLSTSAPAISQVFFYSQWICEVYSSEHVGTWGLLKGYVRCTAHTLLTLRGMSLSHTLNPFLFFPFHSLVHIQKCQNTSG